VKIFFYRIKGQECTAHDARIAALPPITGKKEKKKRRRKAERKEEGSTA